MGIQDLDIFGAWSLQFLADLLSLSFSPALTPFYFTFSLSIPLPLPLSPSLALLPIRAAQVCMNYVDVAVTVASVFEVTSRVLLLPAGTGFWDLGFRSRGFRVLGVGHLGIEGVGDLGLSLRV